MTDAPQLRVVVDTSVFVSVLFGRGSSVKQAAGLIVNHHILLLSPETHAELTSVLARSKFDRFVNGERELLIRNVESSAEWVSVLSVVTDCRDPNDDIFLALALDGRADAIVTGDADLLSLDPWRGVRVLTPQAFVEAHGARP